MNSWVTSKIQNRGAWCVVYVPRSADSNRVEVVYRVTYIYRERGLENY